MRRAVETAAQNVAEYWEAHPCFTTVRVNGALEVVRVFPDVVCDPDNLSADNDVVRFKVGQTYEVPELKAKDGHVLKSSVLVTIIARNEQWLFFKDTFSDTIRRCIAKVKTDAQGRVCEYLKYWGGMIQRGAYATDIESKTAPVQEVGVAVASERKSDAEFYHGEYLRCCRLYQKCPLEESRRRDLYSYMGASMLNAYIDAVSKKRLMRGEKSLAERSEQW